MPQNITTAGPLAYVYPVGAALLVGALLILVLWTPAWRHRARPPPATPKCHRVREIPIDTTEDELRRQLAECLGAHDPAGLRLTLARSSARDRTATLVSSVRPEGLRYPVDSEFIGLTPLFEGDGAAVDIIAVHGLGSHAIGGFKAKDGNNVWLRDFLPEDIPTARVLVYGYNAAIMEDAKHSITDLGKAFLDSCKAFREATQTSRRPIVFVGHSLGGLLIKEALSMFLEDDEDPQNRDFFKSSYALVFFGVPNLGLKLGKLNEITAGQLNAQLIQNLELDTEGEATQYLKELKNKFIRCCKKQQPPFRIVSYYENKKTPTVKMENGKPTRRGEACFMVTQESACRIGIEDNSYHQLPLEADHSGLVKFPTRADDSYDRVRNRLKGLVEAAPGAVQSRFSSQCELSEDEKRHWDDLNVPDYEEFKKWKLAKPAKGTLRWLVQDQSLGIPPGPDGLRKDDSPEEDNSLRKEIFVAWRDSCKPGPLLVTGPPGQGKSVLSNFVVEHLHQSVGNLDRNKVIYYFCNIKNDKDQRTASAILRALIVQLCEDARLFRMLPNRFQDQKERKTFHSATLDELWRTFDDLAKRSPYALIYCVIDGLDVYETGMEDFLRRWKDLMSDTRCRLKLFCTSRPAGLVETITLWPRWTLRPPKEDLERFVDEQLGKFPPKYDLDMKRRIRETVLRRAGGTFLWTSIVLRMLSGIRYPKKKQVDDTIKETPQELNQLYESLVRAAFKELEDVAILAWIIYAKRPLCLQELETAAAVTVNFSAASWTECCKQKARLDSDIIRENLGALVDVIDDKLYLIHQSLRDFLTNNSGIWQQELSLRVPRPELALGKACMTFLSFDDFEVTSIDGPKVEKLENDPFLSYASNFWYQHIDKAEDVEEDVVKLQRILRGPNRRLWIDPYRMQEEQSLCAIAINYDMAWLARLLLDQISSDLSETFGDNCLVQAAARAPRVLHQLLGHATMKRIRVTDKVVKVAAGNWRNGKEVMALLLDRRGNEVKITEDVVKAAAGNQGDGKEVMALLFNHRGAEVKITEDVVKAAAGNWGNGKEVMALLLDQRGNEVKITEDVVKAAAGNQGDSKEVMALLFNHCGAEVKITEDVVKAAAGNWGNSKEVMALLLDQRGNEVKITEDVVKAAARNSKEVVALLLDQCGNEVKITEDVVKAAAGNWRNSKKVMALLLDQRGNEVKITEDVVKAAAGNWGNSKEVMALLLDRRGNEVKITEDVVKAAAGNWGNGEEVMALLLDRRGNEVKVTEDVVKAAAGNSNGKEVMALLLDQRGNEVKITEDVVKAAAGNSKNMMELLLDQRGNEVKITEDVVEAAAGNWTNGKGVMELLLDQRGNEVKITEDVVKAAAGNWMTSKEVMTLLLDRRGNEVKITEDVAKTLSEMV